MVDIYPCNTSKYELGLKGLGFAMFFKNNSIVNKSYIKHELRIARDQGSGDIKGVLFGYCQKLLKKID